MTLGRSFYSVFLCVKTDSVLSAILSFWENCTFQSTSHSVCSQVVYKVIGACVNQSEYMFDLSSVHCN